MKQMGLPQVYGHHCRPTQLATAIILGLVSCALSQIVQTMPKAFTAAFTLFSTNNCVYAIKGGCFNQKKSLSPIERKQLYVINLNFFVWRHEYHRFLLKKIFPSILIETAPVCYPQVLLGVPFKYARLRILVSQHNIKLFS